MCISQLNSSIAAPDVAKYANEPDHRVLFEIMLRHSSARQISRRLHMSCGRFRQIKETGIITERIANRLNSIEGIEIFRANHPRTMTEKEQMSKWNELNGFKPDSAYFKLFAEYFIEWAHSNRDLHDK